MEIAIGSRNSKTAASPREDCSGLGQGCIHVHSVHVGCNSPWCSLTPGQLCTVSQSPNKRVLLQSHWDIEVTRVGSTHACKRDICANSGLTWVWLGLMGLYGVPSVQKRESKGTSKLAIFIIYQWYLINIRDIYYISVIFNKYPWYLLYIGDIYYISVIFN